MQNDLSSEKRARLSRLNPWLKRLGIAGFLFFLAKGLIWLLVPGLLAWFGLGH